MASSNFKVRSSSGTWNNILNVKKHNGSSWVDAQGFYWDGDSWTPMIDRTPDTKDYVKSWDNTWVGGYNGSGSRIRTDSGYQGQFSSNNGNQKAMFGFNLANIRSSLGPSAIINRAMLTFTVTHTYYPTGATFQFGTHNYTGGSAPTTYGPLVKRNVASYATTPRTIYNLSLPVSVGTGLRDGKVAGIVLDTTNTSPDYYGAISAMTLTLDYTR